MSSLQWCWVAVGYLFGSVPMGLVTACLVAREDIRNHGSGNIGATNVGRLLGTPWAVAVALADMAKGGVAVLLAWAMGVHAPWILACTGVAGVCGHNFPVWLGFRGGKGVSTTYGVVVALTLLPGKGSMLLWLTAPLAGALWFVLLKTTRYVSLASIVSLAAIPVILFLFGASGAYITAGVLLALLTAVRHRGNLQRLARGEEPRSGRSS
ncbi:MAG: glycerol-3-phosphate 1-O-acyltransferase PlsY [Synergistales bacterium]|nr:glycerol-3-phosphate 1-O-acyltransferase PlsY [Synergistales bacterium]